MRPLLGMLSFDKLPVVHVSEDSYLTLSTPWWMVLIAILMGRLLTMR